MTTLFAFYNLWGTSVMSFAFVSRCSKFGVDFRNAEKIWHNIFGLGDNCIWIPCVKHSVLMRKNTCDWKSIC